VDFLAHLFFGKPSFVQTRGGSAGEVFTDDGEAPPETVPLEGANNLDSGPVLDVGEDFHVPAEAFFVENIAGGFDLRIIEHGPNIAYWQFYPSKRGFLLFFLPFKESFN
jgi:hypothetical protein